jgi:hypothetical protein
VTAAVFTAWLSAFAVTQLVEVPIYRRGYGAPWSAAFGASAVTHPVVWFVIFGALGHRIEMPYTTRVAIAELFAWGAEALFLVGVVGRPNAVAWAFVANAASVAIGFILRALFGFP